MAANLDIIVSVKGDGSAEIKKITNAAKEAEQSATGLKNKTDALSSSFLSFDRVLKGIALGAIVKETISLADTYNNMQGRLKLVTSSTQNLISVQNELFTISQRARVSFESTSDLYFRLAKSTESLGISQTRLLGVTETISKTLAISGSSAESANAALIQLGQGFASGTLRGEELNSVLEQTPALAEAIAKGMGKTVGELRQLGQDGKLTAEQVFKALENQRKAVEEQFGKMPKTVGQSITQIENSLLALVGSTDDIINGSGGLSDVFSYFSESLDKNRADIIEFGRDFLRSLQAMGAGVIGITTGAMSAVDYIAGGILKIAQTVVNGIIGMSNGAIHAIEFFTNKARSVFGGDNISLGRIAEVSFGDAIMKQSATRFQESANAFKTIGVLVDEIADNTTTISKTSSELVGSSKEVANNHKASAEELKKAAKEAEKIAKWNEEAAKTALNDQIEANQIRKRKLNELADEQAQSALSFYSTIQTEQEKVNDTYLSMYEANKDLYSTEDMNKFFDSWNKSLDGTYKKTEDDSIKFTTVVSSAFQSMEDSMVKMFMTGKFSAQDFFNTVIEGLIRMQIRNSIIEPLSQAIGGINFGSLFKSVSVGGFASGGYTGSGGRNDVAGVVHKGEYVIPQWMVKKSPSLISGLEGIRTKGYAEGGMVQPMAQTTSGVVVNVTNNSKENIEANNVNTRFDGGQMVIDIVIDAITRNKSGMRDIVRGGR